jgi:hypothetical protein
MEEVQWKRRGWIKRYIQRAGSVKYYFLLLALWKCWSRSTEGWSENSHNESIAPHSVLRALHSLCKRSRQKVTHFLLLLWQQCGEIYKHTHTHTHTHCSGPSHVSSYNPVLIHTRERTCAHAHTHKHTHSLCHITHIPLRH